MAVVVLAPWLLGFDTTRHNIALDRIVSGGPPKDGIPALIQPRFVAAAEAGFLSPEDRVIGVALEGTARAYPLRTLNWHEAVNDTVGTTPIAVTYCPLTASAVVFDRRVGGETLSFGISGRLYQSNVLLYDHQSESLWSQLREEAVTGPRTGDRLRALPAVTTTWAAWRGTHPDTVVLSLDTTYQRDYSRDAYARYHASPEIMFPVDRADPRLPPKEKVLGIRIGDRARAYPLARLAAVRQVDDRLGESRVRITHDPAAAQSRVVDLGSGERIAAVEAYWFAWAAFHPGTTVRQSGRE